MYNKCIKYSILQAFGAETNSTWGVYFNGFTRLNISIPVYGEISSIRLINDTEPTLLLGKGTVSNCHFHKSMVLLKGNVALSQMLATLNLPPTSECLLISALWLKPLEQMLAKNHSTIYLHIIYHSNSSH